MIDTSWHSGRKEAGRRGRKQWVGETPLGNKMLFAALVKIMTHQMEHFKEIHTQLSWLFFSFPILSLLCFPLAPRFTVTLSFLPWGISQCSRRAHRDTLVAYTLRSTNTPFHAPLYTHIQVGGIQLQIPIVNLDLFTWVMFPINIFFCVLAFQCVYMCACLRLCRVCLSPHLYLCVSLQSWPFHPCFVPD